MTSNPNQQKFTRDRSSVKAFRSAEIPKTVTGEGGWLRYPAGLTPIQNVAKRQRLDGGFDWNSGGGRALVPLSFPETVNLKAAPRAKV